MSHYDGPTFLKKQPADAAEKNEETKAQMSGKKRYFQTLLPQNQQLVTPDFDHLIEELLPAKEALFLIEDVTKLPSVSVNYQHVQRKRLDS